MSRPVDSGLSPRCRGFCDVLHLFGQHTRMHRMSGMKGFPILCHGFQWCQGLRPFYWLISHFMGFLFLFIPFNFYFLGLLIPFILLFSFFYLLLAYIP